MLHKKWLLMMTAGLVLTVLAGGGCIFSPDPDPTPDTEPPEPYQWPDTADKLMENFERSYIEMSIDAYRDVLHTDYKFIFIGNETWYRDDDLASTDNMFAGNPGIDPETQELKDGVQSIAINTLLKQTPWEDVPANDPDFPNSKKAYFQVLIIFTLDGGLNTITVDSDQMFYVKSEEVDQGDGTTRTRFYLYGQRDIGEE